MLGVPGQYESVALMLSHKMDFNCCANREVFANSVTLGLWELCGNDFGNFDSR